MTLPYSTTTPNIQLKKALSIRTSNHPVSNTVRSVLFQEPYKAVLYILPNELSTYVRYQSILYDHNSDSLIMLPSNVVVFESQKQPTPNLLDVTALDIQNSVDGIKDYFVTAIYQLVSYTSSDRIVFQLWLHLLSLCHSEILKMYDIKNYKASSPPNQSSFYTYTYIGTVYEEHFPIDTLHNLPVKSKVDVVQLPSLDFIVTVQVHTVLRSFIQPAQDVKNPIMWFHSSKSSNRFHTLHITSIPAYPKSWITLEITDVKKPLSGQKLTAYIAELRDEKSVVSYPSISTEIQGSDVFIYHYTYEDRHTGIWYYLQFIKDITTERIFIIPYLLDTEYMIFHIYDRFDIQDTIYSTIQKNVDRKIRIRDVSISKEYICAIVEGELVTDEPLQKAYVLRYYTHIHNESVQISLHIERIIDRKVQKILDFNYPYILFGTETYTISVIV